MQRLSTRHLDQLKVLATLEYAVLRRDMTRETALAQARQEHIPEFLLDTLTRPPARFGTTVINNVPVRTEPDAPAQHSPDTPTNSFLRNLPFAAELRRPPMTLEQASAVCARASERLRFPFVLDWSSESTRIEVDAMAATHIVVPGGVARAPGMTPDALALILAHERGHRFLRTKDEARVDYWAARYGARMLWPDASPDELLEKGFLAAYGVMAFLGAGTRQRLQLLTDDNPKVTVQLSGYPTLQGRWELFKAGLLEREMPPVFDELQMLR